MDPNVALMQAMFFALAGWTASCYRIVHSRLSSRARQLLVIPLWFAWMALALGGPVYQGTVTPANALSAGAALGVGMVVALVLRRRGSRKTR